MAKLYTKTGDDGTTSLFDGSRVAKDHIRVTAYGDVDELSATLGLAASALSTLPARPEWAMLCERIATIQSELFTLGADLATSPTANEAKQKRVPHIGPTEIARLESWIDNAVAPVTPLTTFVLPGGSLAASHFHICRTVCRRAERSVISLSHEVAINPNIVIYLNRVSDLCFAWARFANHVEGVPDVPWVNPVK
ncbi:MAG: cob(I)yrinic acid a,c-diamide adenosyltransferase [Planctomycetes bacterium]|nr:cob(I)yrinic acid a,c-diamide adenosyltransferase [Planctomycetota bacterium]